MNTKDNLGITSEDVKQIEKLMKDRTKLTISFKEHSKDDTKRKKLMWLADSFLIALIVSILFGCIVALASNERFGANAYPATLLMTIGITGTVYRLKSFD